MGHKTPISNVINNSKKIVLKVGSNVLRNDDGTANINVFKNLTDQVAEMMEQGKEDGTFAETAFHLIGAGQHSPFPR